MEPTQHSLSVRIGPRDSRCRHWAKVIRVGVLLPKPEQIQGASDIPTKYLKNGEEELLPGDILIEGEANHHKRDRGWSYRVTWMSEDGEKQQMTPNAEIKALLKEKGMSPDLLKGSGDVAACVRIAHGVRLNLI